MSDATKRARAAARAAIFAKAGVKDWGLAYGGGQPNSWIRLINAYEMAVVSDVLSSNPAPPVTRRQFSAAFSKDFA